MNVIFYILFSCYIFEIWFVFSSYSSSYFRLKFQIISIHMWLVAIMQDSSDLGLGHWFSDVATHWNHLRKLKKMLVLCHGLMILVCLLWVTWALGFFFFKPGDSNMQQSLRITSFTYLQFLEHFPNYSIMKSVSIVLYLKPVAFRNHAET